MAAAALGAHAISEMPARSAGSAEATTPARSVAPSPSPVLDLPARPAAALGGKAFLEATKTRTRPDREDAIVREVLAGNVPSFMRTLVAVDLEARGATVFVTPDYLSIGSDEDFVRTPVDARSAAKIAAALGCVLPTPEIVDAVFDHAAVRLHPQPMPAGAHMVTSEAFLEHHELVERQRAGRPLGWLVAGHKKDVVATARSRRQPGRVAIYGWHRPDGSPIQPLSLVHEETYADYSHGLRLVWSRARTGGGWVDVTQITPDALIASGSGRDSH